MIHDLGVCQVRFSLVLPELFPNQTYAYARDSKYNNKQK